MFGTLHIYMCKIKVPTILWAQSFSPLALIHDVDFFRFDYQRLLINCANTTVYHSSIPSLFNRSWHWCRWINCRLAMCPLTVQISSTGWPGFVYVLHVCPLLWDSHCNLQPRFHQNTTVMAAGVEYCACAHVLVSFLPRQLPTRERPCGLWNKTYPTGRVRFCVQSHFGLGVSH